MLLVVPVVVVVLLVLTVTVTVIVTVIVTVTVVVVIVAMMLCDAFCASPGVCWLLPLFSREEGSSLLLQTAAALLISSLRPTRQ